MEYLNDFFTSLRSNLRIIQFSDILDILVMAYIIYKVLELLRKTHSTRLAKGIVVLVAMLALSSVMNLTMIDYFIRKVLELGLIAVVIIFQPELRRMLERLGNGKITGLFSSSNPAPIGTDTAIAQTVLAFDAMSQSKTGALVVFERNSSLAEHMNTGTIIDADVSSELLRNIFFEPAPLHDGAVIIRDGRIAAAGCMLPLSNNNTLRHDLGMRHRAGVGISEHSDAVVAIVSEETGAISVAINGMMKRHLDIATFEAILRAELMEDEDQPQKPAERLAELISNLMGKKDNEESETERHL